MMNHETSTATRRTITAFFDSRSDAEAALNRLIAAGVDRSHVRIREGASGTGASSSTTAAHGESSGFWEALKDLFLPDEDRATYAEGLRRGGFLVTAQVSEAQYEKALDILDDEGTVDLDHRAETWRREGWTGYTATAATGLGATATGARSATSSTTTTATTAQRRSGASAATGLTEGREEVIPVTEEHLRIGKREVSHGRVRVRSYVVETPVQEQVSLREEHVQVERRPVDRPVTDADNLFRERTIEATETAEEAVIAKEARVKEELVIKKDAEQRTQTVSDTVRRTEVEVEDERGRSLGTGTTGAGATTTRTDTRRTGR